MIIKEIRETVFTQGTTKYYVLDNGYKNWYIPKSCVKKGLDIFQAMPVKTRIGKTLFKKFHSISPIRKMFKAKVEELALTDEIKSIIEEYVKEDYCVAVYGGNWESVQNHKITLQIYNEERIMLYIKMTKEKVVTEMLEQEIVAIEKLRARNIVDLPMVIDLINKNGWTYFVQEPSDRDYETVREFSDFHLEKLKEINEAFAKDCSVEETDIDKLVSSEKARDIKQDDEELLSRAYSEVQKWIESDKVKVSFAHGDFTPWNVYMEKNNLYCFDLEYSQDKATPFFDFFHFICMYSIVAKKSKVTYIREKYNEYFDQINEMTDARMAFMAYLVYIINFYFSRTDDTYDTDRTQYQVRIEMLKTLMEEKR